MLTNKEEFEDKMTRSIKVTDICCKFSRCHHLLHLRSQFCPQFVHFLFIRFEVGKCLAKLVRRLRIFLDRLKHRLNVVPKTSLILFESLVSFNKLFIKLVCQLRQFLLKTTNLLKHLFVCKLLLPHRVFNISFFFDRLFFDFFLYTGQLVNHLCLQLRKQILHFLKVSLCMQLVCHCLEISEVCL